MRHSVVSPRDIRPLGGGQPVRSREGEPFAEKPPLDGAAESLSGRSPDGPCATSVTVPTYVTSVAWWVGKDEPTRGDRSVRRTLAPARAAWVIHRARADSPVDNPSRRAGCGIRQSGVGCPQGAAPGWGMTRLSAPWGQPLGKPSPDCARAPEIEGGVSHLIRRWSPPQL